MNEATLDYVRQHADDDVRKLALQGVKDTDVDLQMALQQIAGRQTARRKLPSWAAVEGIIYPPHLNMEQCSSEQTARYKAKIVNGKSVNGKFADLTGGFGVDFYWMSQSFLDCYYIEQNEKLCAISSENFRLLGLACKVCCCDTTTYLNTMPHVDLIYMDPARRNVHGGRTYDIEDCTPNVIELLPLLMEKANHVMLKLSPMLDWQKAVKDLGHVHEVHIVSVDNECKELLLVIKQQPCMTLKIVCVNNDDIFEFSPSIHPTVNHESLTMNYLYEPNASIMKAGCFKDIEEVFDVCQLSNNSHLFVSEKEIKKFPGRLFHIETVTSMNKQELKAALQGIERANIAVRNFPMSAEALRKKLRLKDGGEVFIFATTLSDNSHKLFICRKIG